MLVLVNAGVDSMGGVIDGGVDFSPSDLEKTQAQLRETFTTAEKFRKELEFLQKGGDPLDLKVGTETSVSLQSTSLTDQHHEQFVTSEVKTTTTSSHEDSVESSGKLGGIGEPNSADNLMLFDGNNNNNKSIALDLPEKSYKRRIRSRPNRHGSRDTKGLVVVHSADNQDHKNLSNSNSTPKSHLDIKSNGTEIQVSDTQETPISISFEKETLSGLDAQLVDDMALLGQSQTKGFDSKSCLDDNNNKNEVVTSVRNVECNGSMEVDIASKEGPNMEGNNVNTVKDDDKIISINNNEIGPTIKEDEGLKGSESVLKSVNSTKGIDSDVCTTSDIEKKEHEEQNMCSENNLKLVTKEYEDSILEEARIIEEKRKKIAAGLSIGILKSESNNNHRSHWDFVLEEMSWLANDFAQERLWKVNAAFQISQKAAYNSRVRIQQKKSMWKQKEVAHILTESVMEFWHNVQVKCKELELEGSKKDSMNGLDHYGKRFLEYNSSKVQYDNSAQAPVTPDRIFDLGITDISWEDNLTEENLFYMVPPGAIEAYRKTIESHLLQSEKTGSSMQEEVDANGYDDVADNNTLEEEEGETSTYYLSKTNQKKRKHGQPPFKSYIPKSYDTGADMSFPQERNIGKRPGTNINVSIPTKRVRTASRPRFIGYNSNNNNNQGLNRTDASSGDTNSFQDEQTSLHNNNNNNNMEVESVADYEKYDMSEVSNRPKKKKKGPTFEHRWQLDSNYHNDNKEHLKRRLDNRQFDSNGNSVGSQMSNMSNPNKLVKLLVRDRGRKAKSLKTPIGQQGSGSPWSLFEDQALVVLVHDMGANWELISDAINSTLQFQCISRNSKECKERHKILMDRSSDGADSAEDSGSSQPYPSTLPGIPEGSARQLFQRLQGPMEEDTLKSHFEKIIVISRKLHFKKSQKDSHNHDPKQLQQPHGSHALALSQVCPNNLNGGPVLTPLDLCEPDFLPVPSSSNSVFGTTVPSPSPSGSNPVSPSVREGRYGIPRIEEQQQRMQQYNQMLSARNMNMATGPRMLPGNGNGVGVMSAMNRGMMIMPRPLPNSNPTVRSREAVHMMRTSDNQRQAMVPEVSQGSFPQQAPAVQQPYPVSPHMPPHHLPTNPQHPAFGMRLLKERQRLRQQQFAAANPVSPHGQQVSSPQSNTQVQSQTSPTIGTPQHLQKPGAVRGPQTGGNVRRPPQQFQQLPPGGRQQVGGKVVKGGGSGPSVPNGFVGLNPNPNPVIQKRFPGQGQSQQQQKSKIVNQNQLTPAQKIILQNRKAANTSDILSTNKLQARGLPLTKPPSQSQTSSADVAPDPNSRNKSETLGGADSSGNKVETGGEHSGTPPIVNHKQQPSS